MGESTTDSSLVPAITTDVMSRVDTGADDAVTTEVLGGRVEVGVVGVVVVSAMTVGVTTGVVVAVAIELLMF